MKFTERFQPATLEALGAILVAALVVSPVVLAQGKPNTHDTTGAKSAPSQSPAKQQQSEHHALSRAQRTAMNQAQAASTYLAQNKADLDKSVLDRYTESIGRALDEAQQERQLLERSAPAESRAADDYSSVRDHQQAAAEHYRSFVQELAKNKPDSGDLEDDAKGLASEMKEAEAAHQKTFPKPGATSSPATERSPNSSPRGETSTGEPIH
jgi:hypothetical protein